MSFLDNLLICLGILQIGSLAYSFVNTFFYYLKWKRWPKSALELQLEKQYEVLAIEIESLKNENIRLTRELAEREADIKNIWLKTINRLP